MKAQFDRTLPSRALIAYANTTTTKAEQRLTAAQKPPDRVFLYATGRTLAGHIRHK